MNKAGSRKAWTVIEKPLGTGYDEGGQPIEGQQGWQQHGNGWADVLFAAGATMIRADIPLNESRASVRYPYRTDLNAGMRIRVDDYVLDIQSVLPDIQRREHVDCVCIMGLTNG